MNFFSFHIGDYTSHTAHLSHLEDLAYRRLLDLYYRQERPISTDIEEVARLIRMKDQAIEIEVVLREFFVLEAEGWRNFRADAEIERANEKRAKARASAEVSVRVRQGARSASVGLDTNERRADVERTPSGRSAPIPKTIPKTITKEKKQEPPVGVSDSVWSDFVILRKNKRAPITETAIKGIEKEARRASMSLNDVLALCCSRGWSGFKAEWLDGARSSNPSTSLAAARTIFGDERRLISVDE